MVSFWHHHSQWHCLCSVGRTLSQHFEETFLFLCKSSLKTIKWLVLIFDKPLMSGQLPLSSKGGHLMDVHLHWQNEAKNFSSDNSGHKMPVHLPTGNNILPEALLSLLAAPCFVFFADVFGDEVTLDWLSDDSDPEEFFLTGSFSFVLSFPLSRCLNIFRQDLERLNSPPLPSCSKLS